MRALTPIVLASLLAACGGGDGDSPFTAGTGTLRLALTDAPACGYDSVNVTIDRVRVHTSSSAGESDAGWHDIVLAQPRRVDLLSLTNGALEELGQTSLPAGTYTQMRLVLAPNTGSTPLANAVAPTGAAEVALDTPSAAQSGLKMNIAITVQAGTVADFIIDFDACKSVVPRGNSGSYNLKPVLRVLPRLAASGARVIGYVDPAMAGISVSAQLDGVPVITTVPDPVSGRFDLYPVPVGQYSIVLSGAGRATAVITGVPVTADAYTFVNSTTSPMLLPASATRTVPVRVTAVPEPETVLLRALQTLSLGTVVEVLSRPAFADGTAVGLPLPVGAPQSAAYLPGAPAPAFAADPGPTVAGRYTVQAVVSPLAPAAPLVKSVPVDVSAGVPDPLPPVAFTFP